jgi:pilus assembly protein CpaE
MGVEIFKQLPNDYRVMAEVRNNGVPLVTGAPRASLTQAILSLSDSLCGSDDSEGDGSSDEPSSSSRWLSFWPAMAKARGGK